MSFDKPDAPDPTATSNAQAGYNQAAATAQNKTNSYNQATPYGSISYVADPNSPSGYRIVTDTSATGQQLLNNASNIATNSAGMYAAPFDPGTATAQKLNQWNADYIAPIFQQQDSNLEAQLRNQGLAPGSEAYNNAKNLLSRNQGDFTTNYLKQNQAQAYDQAMQDYQRPIQTINSLFQTAAPGTFQQTPTAQIQPPNYSGAVQQNYEQQMKSYEQDWANAAKLGSSVIGLAAAPFTGGTSLLGTVGGMFSSSPRSGGW